MNLRDKTLELLQDRPRSKTLKVVSEETGIGLPWLNLFLQNRIQNPSVNTIQSLYEYLTNAKLKV